MPALAMIAAVLAIGAASARAQCGGRLFSTSYAGVARLVSGTSEVRCVINWDPDGPGPAPSCIVIGGTFDVAGTGPAGNIAVWDGSAWDSLGASLGSDSAPPDPSVRALAVYNGDLVAAGRFTRSGDQEVLNIARWDGAAWQPLGSGVDGQVDAMLVFGDDLIVAGTFTAAGGQAVGHVARWDGAAWAPLGVGIDGEVLALAEYDGRVIAAGSFAASGGTIVNNIAQWDGDAWQPVGDGAVATVPSLAVLNNELLACGSFEIAGAVTAVARWNGALWQPLAGVGLTPLSLAVHGGQLFVGGSNYEFIGAGNYTDIARLSRWTGTAWEALLQGSGSHGYIYTMCSSPDGLIAGGIFYGNHLIPVISISNVARWNAGSWSAMGSSVDGSLYPSSYGYGLTTFRGELIACGTFTNAGGVTANRIARWNGLSWNRLGSGMDNAVYAVRVYNGDLIAGGDFATAGGAAASRIARWDGVAWTPLGAGTNGRVRAFAEYNGDLIAAGEFTTAGGAAANRIARWDGASWQPLDAGLNSTVYDLVVCNGELIAGGAFSTAGGVPCSSIAKWNGTVWQPMGAGLNGPVSALTVYNGRPIAGGQFMAGAGSHVAAWTGSSWEGLGALGTGTDDFVNDFEVYDGALYAGGNFPIIGGVTYNGLARWVDGGNGDWEAPGGLGNTYYLATFNGELIITGNFYQDWARYSASGSPWLARQPASILNACSSHPAVFQIAQAVGYPSSSYTWRFNGQPLTDGPRPDGAVISGSRTPTLTITSASMAEMGIYDCIAAGPCGSAPSIGATLAACRADADLNCAIEPADVTAFVLTWLDGLQQGTPAGDFNGDGVLTPSDVAAFITAWLAASTGGC